MLKIDLGSQINWEEVMKAPRYAGGHEEVMRAIFAGNAEVIGEHIDDDYQGTLAFAYRFPDGGVVIITDYFGSCGVCDAWECCGDDDARQLVSSMVNSARVFDNVDAARDFCKTATNDAFDYPFYAAQNLKF